MQMFANISKTSFFTCRTFNVAALLQALFLHKLLCECLESGNLDVNMQKLEDYKTYLSFKTKIWICLRTRCRASHVSLIECKDELYFIKHFNNFLDSEVFRNTKSSCFLYSFSWSRARLLGMWALIWSFCIYSKKIIKRFVNNRISRIFQMKWKYTKIQSENEFDHTMY